MVAMRDQTENLIVSINEWLRSEEQSPDVARALLSSCAELIRHLDASLSLSELDTYGTLLEVAQGHARATDGRESRFAAGFKRAMLDMANECRIRQRALQIGSRRMLDRHIKQNSTSH